MYPYLLVGSQSSQRHELLAQAQIPFKPLAAHSADESICDWTLPFEKILKSITLSKMDNLIIADPQEGQTYCILTADTMVQDSKGAIHGKPTSREHARETINALRDKPGRVGTAFCINKKIYRNNKWELIQQHLEYVEATFVLDIPDSWIEGYLDQNPDYVNVAGALSIEGEGALFLKSLNGSYTAALGLPIYQVRLALEALGFFQ